MESYTTPHIFTSFDESLRELRKNALMMASLTERSLERAEKGLFERDEDWCNTVIADDEEIDTLEIQIDQDGIGVMLKFHPVASDMRTVVSTMKLSVNLERIADQTVNIARRARKLLLRPSLEVTAKLRPLFDFSTEMVKDAVRAFADGDVDLARGLRVRDRELDRFHREFADEVTDLMPNDPQNIPSYMDLIFTAKFIERIGDQAKNIGDDTVYALLAEDIRHQQRRKD